MIRALRTLICTFQTLPFPNPRAHHFLGGKLEKLNFGEIGKVSGLHKNEKYEKLPKMSPICYVDISFCFPTPLPIASTYFHCIAEGC